MDKWAMPFINKKYINFCFLKEENIMAFDLNNFIID